MNHLHGVTFERPQVILHPLSSGHVFRVFHTLKKMVTMDDQLSVGLSPRFC